MEYSQRKRTNLGDLIQETLELFEIEGGLIFLILLLLLLNNFCLNII